MGHQININSPEARDQLAEAGPGGRTRQSRAAAAVPPRMANRTRHRKSVARERGDGSRLDPRGKNGGEIVRRENRLSRQTRRSPKFLRREVARPQKRTEKEPDRSPHMLVLHGTQPHSPGTGRWTLTAEGGLR